MDSKQNIGVVDFYIQPLFVIFLPIDFSDGIALNGLC